MQLPPSLRAAIERELDGIALADLARASKTLSQRYRDEVQDGRLHLSDDLAARAYLTTRLPATFAAISAALKAVAEATPEFAPRSVLDAGAGPGTATWAAAQRWGSIEDATLVEASPAIRAIGERLDVPIGRTRWIAGRLDAVIAGQPPRDLAMLAYVLDELPEAARGPLIDRLWNLTGGTLLILEPGTPAGWQRVLQARDRLLDSGAHILAPCPHAKACPLAAPDWCHFSARVARSRLHRQAKSGTVPWEDEKFIYLAASRQAPGRHAARVIAPAHLRKPGISLKLCRSDGVVENRMIARRDRSAFKHVNRLDWGDLLEHDGPLGS